MDLVPVSESPINKNTAYKYHSQKKHPGLIIKLYGRLYVNMDVFNKAAEQATEDQIKEAKRLYGSA